MDKYLMEQFIASTLRFQKADLCLMPQGGVQYRELVIMGSVCGDSAHGCSSLNAHDICEKLQITKPAVSQTLNNLEKKGYITRDIDPADRRKISVTVTGEGRVVMDEVRQSYDDALTELMERFGAENIRTLVALLDELNTLYAEIKNKNGVDKR